MESSKKGLKSIFTTIPTVINVLPYFGYADSMHCLMMEFNSKSRKFWTEDICKWSRVFSEFKKSIGPIFPEQFEKIQGFWPEMLFKYCFRINYACQDVENLIMQIKESSPIEIEMIKIEQDVFSLPHFDVKENSIGREIKYYTFYEGEKDLFIKKLKLLCEAINISQEKLGMNKLVIQCQELAYNRELKIYNLPEPFVITEISYQIGEVYIFDSRIKIPIDEFMPALNRVQFEFFQKWIYYVSSLEELEDFFGEDLTRPLNRFLLTSTLYFWCWDRLQLSSGIKKRMIEALKLGYTNLQDIYFKIECDIRLAEWGYWINQIVKIFPNCYFDYEGETYIQHLNYTLSCSRATFVLVQGTKKVIFHFENCTIRAGEHWNFESKDTISFLENFHAHGKIISVEIDEELSEEDNKYILCSGRSAEARDCSSGIPKLTVMIDNVESICLVNRSPLIWCKALRFCLLNSGRMCRKPIAFEDHFAYKAYDGICQNYETQMLDSLRFKMQFVNLNKINLSFSNMKEENMKIIEHIIEGNKNLVSASFMICDILGFKSKDILERFCNMMKKHKHVMWMNLKCSIKLRRNPLRKTKIIPIGRTFSYVIS
ncbi:unnamed protein product [Moneuplotes crassus]|uniref:Uncharacterized protein n=1 Tax=Euplotes crassus TaxID=5936 RepID=A0AAD1U0Y8_EUPCR|nr:unnamed protein product [Moneuplotes crassus]